jgi:hypothetical protein
MKKWGIKVSIKQLFALVLISSWLLTGYPVLIDSPRFPPAIKRITADQTSPLFAGTGANYNDGGNLGWTAPINAQGDTTDTAATISLGANGHTSQRLRLTNFGFNIPSTAIINGVIVEVEASSTNNNRQRWNSVQLLKATSETGTNKSDNAAINAKAFKTFGSASDVWGTTISASEVNDSGFGVSLKIERNSTQTTTTSIFRVRITVDYTPISAPSVSTQAVSSISYTTADANGTISATGGENADIRGFVYDTSSKSAPGNVAPASSGYAFTSQDSGSFATGAFAKTLTDLASGTTYYVRAFAHNSAGYGYGDEISFTTVYLSVSITSDGTIDYGILTSNQSKSTIELSDSQTAQNNGTAVANFNIKSSAPSGWTLATDTSEDTFVHEFSSNGGLEWTKFASADSYQLLSSNVALNSSVQFDLRLTAPNPSTTTDQKNITITIQVVDPSIE